MQELRGIIEDFRSKRGWQKWDSEANLAKSIIIEAAELLEHFQWSEEEFDKKEVEKELADILMYSLVLCYHMNLDPKEIIVDKLEDVARRYPEKNKNK